MVVGFKNGSGAWVEGAVVDLIIDEGCERDRPCVVGKDNQED